MSTSSRTASIGSDRFIFSKTGSCSSSNRPCQSFIFWFPGLLLIAAHLRSHGCGKSDKVDEAFGVVLIVVAGFKRRDVVSIETVGGRPTGDRQIALVKVQRNGACHRLLGFVDERVERFA